MTPAIYSSKFIAFSARNSTGLRSAKQIQKIEIEAPKLPKLEELASKVKASETGFNRDDLITNPECLKLVRLIANRFSGKGLPLEDLIGEGTVGLVLAVQKLKTVQNNQFSQHATNFIVSAIKKGLILNKDSRNRTSNEETIRRVHYALGMLTHNERDVIESLFGIGKRNAQTAEKIANRQRRSPSYVIGLSKRILNKLRPFLDCLLTGHHPKKIRKRKARC